MASLRTEITEIVTGLGMLPLGSIEEALQGRPATMVGVADNHYDRLSEALRNPASSGLFQNAWANGKAFAQAREGLRGRTPLRVEWKGPHQLPGYEQIPVDLRVDYVYLVSCKYGSKLLHNASPSHLFDRLLAIRRGPRSDWYNEVAPGGYQRFYTACRDYLGDTDLPEKVTDLNREQPPQESIQTPLAFFPQDAVPAIHYFGVKRLRSTLGVRAGRQCPKRGRASVAPAAFPARALLCAGNVRQETGAVPD